MSELEARVKKQVLEEQIKAVEPRMRKTETQQIGASAGSMFMAG